MKLELGNKNKGLRTGNKQNNNRKGQALQIDQKQKKGKISLVEASNFGQKAPVKIEKSGKTIKIDKDSQQVVEKSPTKKTTSSKKVNNNEKSMNRSGKTFFKTKINDKKTGNKIVPETAIQQLIKQKKNKKAKSVLKKSNPKEKEMLSKVKIKDFDEVHLNKHRS